jgi:hypothetical protein
LIRGYCHSGGVDRLAIYRKLQEASFGPDEIERMTSAYEIALRELEISRSNPATETIAQKIVEVTRDGERDPVLICVRALSDLRLRR